MPQTLEDESIASRAPWADACRVIAIFGVIAIHSCGAPLQPWWTLSLRDWLTAVNWIDSFARSSVPIFVMLSGALLLGRKAEPVTLAEVSKRVIRVLIPLVFWSAFYLSYVSFHSGKPVQWFSILYAPSMYHLWFVYMIVGLYLLLPVFQAVYILIVDRPALQLYLLALWVVITCIPSYLDFPLPALIHQQNLFGYGGYFLIGAVIAGSPAGRVPTILWCIVFLAGVACTAMLTSFWSISSGAFVDAAYLYFSPNVLLMAVAAFKVLSRLKFGARVAKVLSRFSDLSFLIFFMHVLVVERIATGMSMLNEAQTAPTSLLVFLTALFTFIACAAMAAMIRLVPCSKRFLG